MCVCVGGGGRDGKNPIPNKKCFHEQHPSLKTGSLVPSAAAFVSLVCALASHCVVSSLACRQTWWCFNMEDWVSLWLFAPSNVAGRNVAMKSTKFIPQFIPCPQSLDPAFVRERAWLFCLICLLTTASCDVWSIERVFH